MTNETPEQKPSEESLQKIRSAVAAGRVEFPQGITGEYMPVGNADGIIAFEPEITDVSFRENAVCIRWRAKHCGFGELTLWKDEDGHLHRDCETMGKERSLKILEAWLELSTE